MKIPSYLYNKKYSGVYCIENSFNHKRYIGSSNSMYQRLHKHNSLLNHDKHENAYLQNSWNKHGGEIFECYVLEFCIEADLTLVEQKWIDELNPEYNFTKLVQRNILSEESRRKVSETLKEGYRTGRISKTKTTPVNCYDMSGNFIKSYATIRECARSLKMHVCTIIRVLKGVYNQSGGYQFRRVGDNSFVGEIKYSKYCKNRPAPVKLGELSGKPVVSQVISSQAIQE